MDLRVRLLQKRHGFLPTQIGSYHLSLLIPMLAPMDLVLAQRPPVVNTQYLYGGDDVELPDPAEETMVDWFSSVSYVWPYSGNV